MLSLSRKPHERIIIDDRIIISILDVRGDKVRLGIEAPPDMPIHREEVWRNIQAGVPRKQEGQP